MALNSFNFLLYFAVLFAFMCVVEFFKRRFMSKALGRVQIVTLLLFSYFTIFKVDFRFCLCVLVTTAFVYAAALLINKGNNKKLWLCVSVTALVLSLGYFKYCNFFIESFSRVFGVSATNLDIILPVGISFYTFSAISYIVDVYRARYDAVTNFIDFSLYIAFFPKFVSGPIVRGKTFFPQLTSYRGITKTAALEGVQIFAFGLFKKCVLADRLGVFVNDVFFAPTAYNSPTVIWAVVSYSLQIYFDFSGYSDMAIGISKMLGFDFERNFNLPYISKSFSEFWKRWHISLSSWFTEYLYIPLGGSRKGEIRTYINLLIVMLVSGLWHGAGITFILWGFLHGVVVCIGHIFRKKGAKQSENKVLSALKALGVYIVVALLWVPFRASSLSNALQVLKACFVMQDGVSQPYMWTFIALACIASATVLAVIKSKKENKLDRNGKLIINGYYPVMGLGKFLPLCAFFVFCGLIIILGYFGETAFIYGNF